MKIFFTSITFLLSIINCPFTLASEDLGTHLEFTETKIHVGSTTLFCRTIGSGAPLVVLHGGPGLTQDYLLPEMAKLSEENFVIFYDQRGCGQSTCAVHADSINLENFINDLDVIRQHFNLDKISVLGHSWGGFLAMQYAIAYPEFVDKLILSNSIPASNDEFMLFTEELTTRLAPYQEEMERILESKEFAAGDQDTVDTYYRLVSRAYCYNPEKANLLNFRMSSVDTINGEKVRTIFRENYLSKYFNLHAELGTLDIPTLVIHGDADPIPFWMAENLHTSILNSKYVLIPNCGHFPYIEETKIYLLQIKEFLKAQPAYSLSIN